MDMSDIVVEILSRLLVKDLLRCKSVCKSWYSLISSPFFVETHRKFMCNKEDIYTRRIAMITPDWAPRGCTYHMWIVEGSSNGLVCIYRIHKNRIIVTNPLTGVFRELPRPPLGHVPSYYSPSYYSPCMGFGYDSSTDDYKVVMATCNSNSNNTVLVHILSLKSNIWKPFGQSNYRFIYGEPGIIFNGALHWFWIDANDTRDDKVLIVSFHLAKEEFREVPQPDDMRYDWNNDNYSLGIMEGRLCITSSYDNDHPRCSIWVIKNYNGKPSWELLPITNYCEMKDQAIHYMLKDSDGNRITPPPIYYCDDNIQFSRRPKYISSPIFVQTLVSPYVNNTNNGRPSRTKNNKSTVSTGRLSHSKNNKSTVKAWRVKEKRETEEEERGVVTNTYKNGSKGKERLLKSFWKKKERVE